MQQLENQNGGQHTQKTFKQKYVLACEAHLGN